MAENTEFANYDLVPLKKMLEVGNPDRVHEVSGHWSSVAAELQQAAQTLQKIVQDAQQHWEGDAADGFAKKAGQIQTSLVNTAQYAEKASCALAFAGDALKNAQTAMAQIPDPSELDSAAKWVSDFGQRSDATFKADLASGMDRIQAVNKNYNDLSAGEVSHQYAIGIMEHLAPQYIQAASFIGTPPGKGIFGDPVTAFPPPPADPAPPGGYPPPTPPPSYPSPPPTGGNPPPSPIGQPQPGPQPILPHPVSPQPIQGGPPSIPNPVISTPPSTGIDGIGPLPSSPTGTGVPPVGGGGVGTGGGGLGGLPGGGIGTGGGFGGIGIGGIGLGLGSSGGGSGSGSGGRSGGLGGSSAIGEEEGVAGTGAAGKSGLPGSGVVGGRPGASGLGGMHAPGGLGGAKGGGAGGKSSGLVRRSGGTVGGASSGNASRSAFTEGGTGLGRNRGTQGAAGMPGTHGTSKKKKENGSRPDYLVEDEDTWQTGGQVNPPVIE